MSEITAEELARRLASGAPTVLVDVREPWEHATAAIPSSRLVPLGQLGARAGGLDIPGDALVVVYCHHGIRSLSGAAILAQHGIEALSLRGGIDAWSASVDPTVPRY